jgi:hypothetical protein
MKVEDYIEDILDSQFEEFEDELYESEECIN